MIVFAKRVEKYKILEIIITLNFSPYDNPIKELCTQLDI